MGRRTLDRAAAQSFYDRFGSKQDKQGWYEDPALTELLDHAKLEEAGSLLEFGCGTGRLAERIFRERLGPTADYLGVDLSTTMLQLADARLAPFGDRAQVAPADATGLPTRAGGWDRVLSTYVLDLLDEAAAREVVAQAHAVLAPHGLLCLAGVTWGRAPAARLVMGGWDLLHRLSPRVVGGCRPIVAHSLLAPTGWRLLHHQVVETWGVASEVLVAERS